MNQILDKFVGQGETSPPPGYDWNGQSVGGRYWQTFPSLDAARQDPKGYVVLESHCGGVILLLAPARLVHCSEETLITLLHDMQLIDFHATVKIPFDGFHGNTFDREATFEEGDIRYERYEPGQSAGGSISHSAQAGENIHIHPDFIQLGLEDQIKAVLANQQPRLIWQLQSTPSQPAPTWFQTFQSWLGLR